jgi:CO/xanthine dehydrogenase Mo-binding subunit
VLAAAQDAKNQIIAIASRELDSNPEEVILEDGVAKVPGTDREIPLHRIAALSTGFGGRYGPVLGNGAETIKNQAPGTTAQAVEVEVDEETGMLTVTRVAAVQDVGKAINWMTVMGQLEGGVVQSLGMGLTEEMLYDDRGRLRNPTFLDYRLLTSLDVPTIEGILVEVPAPEGPFGARIVGEPSIIAASTALANAVRDVTGVRLYEAPLTPERVAAALAEANGKNGAH